MQVTNVFDSHVRLHSRLNTRATFCDGIYIIIKTVSNVERRPMCLSELVTLGALNLLTNQRLCCSRVKRKFQYLPRILVPQATCDISLGNQYWVPPLQTRVSLETFFQRLHA